MSIFTIVFFGVILSSCKRRSEEKQFLNQEELKVIRGIFAFCIVCDHIALILWKEQELKSVDKMFEWFGQSGPYIVAAFLFFSGYGLYKSWYTKGDCYIKSFPQKRFVSLLVPWGGMILLSFLIRNLLLHENITVAHMISSLFNGSPIVPNGWYVMEQLLFYIIFYIGARIFGVKNRMKAFLFNFILVMAFVGFTIYLRYPEGWFISAFSFVLGEGYALFEEKNFLTVKRFYNLWLVTIGTLCLFLHVITGKLTNVILKALLMNLSGGLFVCCVLILSYKFVIENKLLKLLGKISYELYMIHGLVILVFRSDVIYIYNKYWFLMAVVGVSILAAVVFYNIDCVLLSFINMKLENKEKRNRR